MKLFGYQITRETEKLPETTAVVNRNELDGATEVSGGLVAFYAGISPQDSMPLGDEVQLITKYRDLSMQPEIQKAVDDIVNEAFAYDNKNIPISLNLSDVPTKIVSEATKKVIFDEFEYLMNLLNFKNDCYEIFRRWYVDGRIYYEKIIDKDKIDEGIKELRYVDSRLIKKVKEVMSKKDANTTHLANTKTAYRNFYIYNPEGFSNNTSTGIRIAPDSIAYCSSGIMDRTNTTVISWLQQAIKPYNQYKMMKDSMVIYYHTRAPERRLFNVEIGGMTRMKAEQYMNEVITKFRRKMVYDPSTGDMKDDKRFMSMNEDFWFPSREGRGTSVDVLSGGANLSEINDVVQMYKKELFDSLNVPLSRYSQEATPFNMGRSSEITRDELKFSKFISRLRNRFSGLIEDILGTHLILKNIFTKDEWDEIKGMISYDYREDNHHTEFFNSELLSNRLANFQMIENLIGSYFSKQWAVTNVLCLSEEEWDEMKKQIEKEKEDEPEDPDQNQYMGGDPNQQFDQGQDPNAEMGQDPGNNFQQLGNQ